MQGCQKNFCFGTKKYCILLFLELKMSKTTVFGTIYEKRQFFTIINIYFPSNWKFLTKKLDRIRRFLLLNRAEGGKNDECWPQAGKKLNNILYFDSYYRKF